MALSDLFALCFDSEAHRGRWSYNENHHQGNEVEKQWSHTNVITNCAAGTQWKNYSGAMH